MSKLSFPEMEKAPRGLVVGVAYYQELCVGLSGISHDLVESQV